MKLTAIGTLLVEGTGATFQNYFTLHSRIEFNMSSASEPTSLPCSGSTADPIWVSTNKSIIPEQLSQLVDEDNKRNADSLRVFLRDVEGINF